MAATNLNAGGIVDASANSKWGQKLEKKLKKLADSASKESIQTLANWIGFHRKHATSFTKVLADALIDCKSNVTRQWLYWQVIHEVLILYNQLRISSGSAINRWEKMSNFRTAIAESTIAAAIEGLGSSLIVVNGDPHKLDSFLKEWDEYDVFGGPTLVSQIRRSLTSAVTAAASAASANNQSEGKKQLSEVDDKKGSSSNDPSVDVAKKPPPTAANPSPAAKQPPAAASVADSSGEIPTVDTDTIANGPPEKITASSKDVTPTQPATSQSQQQQQQQLKSEPQARRRSSLASLTQEIEYDFESKGVPYGKVESREFLDPCKAIATLQIARDLRNDAAVQLSSLLSTIPEDIQDTCRRLVEESEAANDTEDGDKVQTLDAGTIRDFSIRIPSKLLDLDLEEQIQTIKTFQDLVRKQRAARETLIFLLLKSRCQFGSRPAAQEFFDLQTMSKTLAKRRNILSDALELEGLDSEIDATDYDDQLMKELPPLKWFLEEKKAEEETKSTEVGGEPGHAKRSLDSTGEPNKKARVESR